MHLSPTDGQTVTTSSVAQSLAGDAVGHLQRAVRSGRPVLVPGGIEPRHPSREPSVIAPEGPFGPDLSPVRPEDRARRERNQEAGGTPAEPVTVLDFVNRTLLRLTDFLIARLRTTPRVV